MLQSKQKQRSFDIINLTRGRGSFNNSSKSIILAVDQSTLDQYKSIRISNISKSRIKHKFTTGITSHQKDLMRKTRKWQSILGHYMQAQAKIQKLKDTQSSHRYSLEQQDQIPDNIGLIQMTPHKKLQIQANVYSDKKIKYSSNGISKSFLNSNNQTENFKLAIKRSTSSNKPCQLNLQSSLSPRVVNFVDKYLRKKYKVKKYRKFPIQQREQSFTRSLALKQYQ